MGLDVTNMAPGVAPLYVQSRISAPEFVDWHMILDQELSQLSRPETGVIASLGFVGLGAAIGLLVPFLNVVEKVNGQVTNPPPVILESDVACVGAFIGSAVLCVVCLAIAGIAWSRNKGLAGEIRNRTKRGVGAATSAGNG
jgi:hypothetical protein